MSYLEFDSNVGYYIVVMQKIQEVCITVKVLCGVVRNGFTVLVNSYCDFVHINLPNLSVLIAMSQLCIVFFTIYSIPHLPHLSSYISITNGYKTVTPHQSE